LCDQFKDPVGMDISGRSERRTHPRPPPAPLVAGRPKFRGVAAASPEGRREVSVAVLVAGALALVFALQAQVSHTNGTSEPQAAEDVGVLPSYVWPCA
jgi:hypothetical protein